MNQLTLSECSKRKLDATYLVVYAIKNVSAQRKDVQKAMRHCKQIWGRILCVKNGCSKIFSKH